MPKETKDIKEKVTKKTVAKKSSTKTVTSKKVASKKTAKASAPKSTKKATSTTTKKATTTKKSTMKKSTTTSKAVKATEKPKFINEYYDLPYRYNQTIVKILAQTPKKLFVYWDISDEDRNNLEKTYGENFFEKTKPVLVVHNNTLDYSFEIDVNDYANCWYLNIEDANCEYTIELGRRPNQFNYTQSENNKNAEIPQYIYISSSNNLETPNNKVLFNPPVYKTVYFRNVKTSKVIAKDILNFPFVSTIQNIGEFYNVYDLYKNFYKDEELNYMNNPSSGNSSSMNFSSQFK